MSHDRTWYELMTDPFITQCYSEQYQYSFAELTDMHIVYGELRSNVLAAERLYRERFPKRHHPSRRVFIYKRRRETSSLQRRHEGPGNMRTTRTSEFEEEVLGRVEADPTTSTHHVALEMGAAQSSMWRLLHELQLHPYHPRVCVLLVTDLAPRVAPCQWVLQWIDRPDYLRFMLFTDEASFHHDGIWNSWNTHVWDEANPYAVVVTTSNTFCCKYLGWHCRRQSHWDISFT